MNKNTLKLSIILILVYSFTLPSFVYAYTYTCHYPLATPRIEFGTQFFQLFSLVLLFLTVTLGAFLKFLKVRFSAIKHKKLALLGIAVLLAVLSFGGAYLWLYGNPVIIQSLFTASVVLLSITAIFVLLFKFLKTRFSAIKHKKIALLIIAVLFIVISLIGIFLLEIAIFPYLLMLERP